MHVQDKRERKRQKGLCESLFLGELKSVGDHLLMTSEVDGGRLAFNGAQILITSVNFAHLSQI